MVLKKLWSNIFLNAIISAVCQPWWLSGQHARPSIARSSVWNPLRPQHVTSACKTLLCLRKREDFYWPLYSLSLDLMGCYGKCHFDRELDDCCSGAYIPTSFPEGVLIWYSFNYDTVRVFGSQSRVFASIHLSGFLIIQLDYQLIYSSSCHCYCINQFSQLTIC